MGQSSTITKLKSLMPYFLLALLIIMAYRISGEIESILGLLGWLWAIMAPFFYGFLLAYVINMPCGSIQRLIAISNINFLVKRKKGLSLVIVLLLLVLLIFLALNWIIPAVADSTRLLISTIPAHWDDIVQMIDNFNNSGRFDWQINPDNILEALWGLVENIGIDIIAAPLSAIVGAANTIFRGAISFIASIYIMIEKEKFKAFVDKLLRIFTSDKFSNFVVDACRRLNKNLRRYIHTQTLGGIILSVMSMIALAIMGSPYILLIGIMLWLANYIPYFGSIIAVIVAILIVTFTQGLTMGLIATGVLILIQQIEVNIIQPKLMSDAFSMSPLLVIISISVGGAIAGILGMVVVIPIVAVLKDIFSHVVDYYERKKNTKREI